MPQDQGIENTGKIHRHTVQLVHPNASAADGDCLHAGLFPADALHGQHRRVGVRLPQLNRVNRKGQPFLRRHGEALRDAKIVGPHSQKARHQRAVRAVALSGLGKGAV